MVDSDDPLNDLLRRVVLTKQHYINKSDWYAAGHLHDVEKKLTKAIENIKKERFVNKCLKIMIPNDNNSSKEM